MRFDIQICPGKLLSLEYFFTSMNVYGVEEPSEESKHVTSLGSQKIPPLGILPQQQTILRTPAECPRIQVSSNIIYPEIPQIPQVKGLALQDCPLLTQELQIPDASPG